jgi:hypothetical protein
LVEYYIFSFEQQQHQRKLSLKKLSVRRRRRRRMMPTLHSLLPLLSINQRQSEEK